MRRADGDNPCADEYHVRFPDRQQLIDDVFRSFNVAGDSTVPPSLAGTLEFDSRTPSETVTLGRGERMDRYLIRRILSQGGFGTVYLAYDEELDREVAVKAPSSEKFDSPESIDRFIQEARKLAKLKHHGIVSVYDVGHADDGRPFVVMQYVEGKTLGELVQSGRLSNQRAAGLLCDVAEAVAYAHKQGLVHRDLKPSNVLVDSEGKPLVADFGLAVDEREQRRRAGELAGTLPYMAPEQVRGDVHRLDGRTDIWALGVILYRILTGRLPFGGDSVEQLSDEIQHRAPKPPRQIDEKIAPELERIISKCCAKNVGGRYSTAADLAADLRRYCEPEGTRHAVEQDEAARPSRQVQHGLKVGNLGCAIAILAACLFIVTLFVMPKRIDRNEVEPQGVAQPDGLRPEIDALAPLEGTIDLRVWDPGNESRHGLSLHDPAARPLKTDDRVRIETRLNKPAYVYILWVDSEGTVLPLYPWQPGDWESRPSRESPVKQVSLPVADDEAWPLEGEPGMETLLMLVRESPLPAEVDLKQALSALPRQAAKTPGSLIEFVNSQVVIRQGRTDRGPKLYDPQKIDDPVLTTQRIIKEKLGEHFRYTRTVSFANAGAR
ncbi:MAG: serine/threonine-protein kinase [Pirellulales bacterium]